MCQWYMELQTFYKNARLKQEIRVNCNKWTEWVENYLVLNYLVYPRLKGIVHFEIIFWLTSRASKM